MDRRTKLRTRLLLPCLTALALVLAASAAAAHELEHALEQHDEPACALHLLAGHAGKALTSAVIVVAAVVHRSIASTPHPVALPCPAFGAPRARSPPAFVA